MKELDIIKLKDPGNFLARDLPGETRTFKEYEDMKAQMSKYLNNVVEQGEPPIKPSLGDICAAQRGDIWHRLRIEEFIPNSKGQKVRCFLIDVGSEVSVNTLRLHRIPAKFKNFPAQVRRCCLSGVQPLTMQVSETETGLQAMPGPNKKWDPSATTFMTRMEQESTKCRAETVKEGGNGILYLKLYFYIDSEWINFNEELINRKYAIYTDSDVISDSISSTSFSSGKFFPSSNNPGSNRPRPRSPDSCDSSEMPPLSDFTDSETSFENCSGGSKKNEKRMLSSREEILLKNDYQASDVRSKVSATGNIKGTSPIFSKFLNRVPKTELAACPPMPPLESLARSPEKDNYNQTRLRNEAKGVRQNSKELPVIGKGRAALLYQAIKNTKTGFSSKDQNQHDQPPPLSPVKSKSPSPRITASSLSSLDSWATSDSESIPYTPAPVPVSSSVESRRPKKSLSQMSALLLLDSSPNTTCEITPPSVRQESTPKTMTVKSPVANRPSTKSPPKLVFGKGLSPKSRQESQTKVAKVLSDSQGSPTKVARDLSDSLSSHSSEIRNMGSPRDMDEVSQVLSDGLQSSASGVGVRLRERRCLSDVIIEDQGAGLDKKGEIANDKKKYIGQQEGRKFLEKLRMRSGLQMISPEEAVPQTSLHSKSHQNPKLGTLVYGKSVPMAVYKLEQFHFTRTVEKVLKETFDREIALGIEAFTWPSILRGRHVIGIGIPGHENTLAYVPPLITLLSDKKSYQSVPLGTGPLALIVVPTWKKVHEVLEKVECFVGSSMDGSRQIKCIPLYAGGTESDRQIQLSMMKGYEILITTPNSLLRKNEEKMVNLKRICHVIVDDVDILLSRFPSEIEHIMEIFNTCVKARGDTNIPQQILIFSKLWTNEIDSFRQRHSKEPVITFSSRVEASVYGNVRQVVTLSVWENRLEKFCSLVDRMSGSSQKVIAWTTNVCEAVEISKALSSQGIYTLLAHHEFDSDEFMEEVKLRWHEASQSKNLTVLVSTDPCYEDLAITDATTVIHFDIPSRTCFGNRLACMYQYFSDRMSDYEPSIEPVSHIILTQKSPAHARSLFDLLRRGKSTYPRQLEEFIRGYQWGLQNEQGKELCPLLKAFGSCQNDRCELRHFLAPDTDFKTGEASSNDLPSSGEVKCIEHCPYCGCALYPKNVTVIHVVNSTRFYCHLLQHRPLDRKEYIDKRISLLTLNLEMSAFYSKPRNHVPYLPSENLFEDGLCGFKGESGTVQRAKVLEVREGSHRDPMKQCKVWLVDQGIYQFGTIDQLVKLPKLQAEVPYQAVEIFVCRIKPVDHDLEWTKKADIFIENLVKEKELIGRIVLRLGMTLWLDPLVHQVKLKGVGAANDLVIRQELLSNNFATLNPDHIKSLYELCRGKTEIPENIMLQYFDYCLEIEMTQETLPMSQDFHEINMVAIFSPSLFYVQRWDKIAEMDELEIQIEKEIKKTLEDKERKSEAKISLDPGSVCLAESDGKWYRAKILDMKEDGRLNVFLLDFGNSEDVMQSQIRPLRRHLAKLPCQAIECELAFISPKGKEWPSGTVDLMCNFAQYVDEVQKCVVAKVESRVDALHTMGQKLVINIQDAGGVTLSEDLVWRHKGICKDEANYIMPLFGKPALKNQKFFNRMDMIPYLTAMLYWCETSIEAVHLAEELGDLLALRREGWETVLEDRDLFRPVVKLIGYIPCDEANGIVLKALVRCCKESPRLCEMAIEDYLTFTLNSSLEMVNKCTVQQQALEAISELMAEERFVIATCSCELKRTLMTLLHLHQTSPLEHQYLQYLCNAVAKCLSQETDSHALDSNCDSLLTLIQQMTTNQGSSDKLLEPWLGLLLAVANSSSHRAHRHIMRENYIDHVISLLERVKKPQCLFRLLSLIEILIEKDRKYKTILLEHKALIAVKRILTSDLDYPIRCLCEAISSSLNLSFPTPETLSGTRLHPGQKEEKNVAPMVTWTESCFRVMLKIQVRNASAEEFVLGRNRLQCNVMSDNERSVLDWELYGDIVTDKSSVSPSTYFTIVSLKKDKKGKWGRLLRNKTKPPNLNADFERLLNSDEEEDNEDDESFFKRQEKRKGIFDGLPAVRLGNLSSEDSSSHDSLVMNSSDNENEPKVDYEAFFKNYKSSKS